MVSRFRNGIKYEEGPDGVYRPAGEGNEKEEIGKEETGKGSQKISDVKEVGQVNLAENFTETGDDLRRYLPKGPTDFVILLTDEEEAKVAVLKDQLDVSSGIKITEFSPTGANGSIKEMSKYIGDGTRMENMGKIGEYVGNLQTTLRRAVRTEGSNFWKLVYDFKEKILSMRDANRPIDVNLDSVEKTLSEYIELLKRDIAVMEETKKTNYDKFFEIELYRRAALEKLKEMIAQAEEIKAKHVGGEQVLSQIEVVEYQSLLDSVDLLKKKVYDLFCQQMLSETFHREMTSIEKYQNLLLVQLYNGLLNVIPEMRMSSIITVAAYELESVIKASKALKDTHEAILVETGKKIAELGKQAAEESERPPVSPQTIITIYKELLQGSQEASKLVKKLRDQNEKGMSDLKALHNKLQDEAMSSIPLIGQEQEEHKN